MSYFLPHPALMASAASYKNSKGPEQWRWMSFLHIFPTELVLFGDELISKVLFFVIRP
jgi:hypothetical protein